jgi:hypothetical protein
MDFFPSISKNNYLLKRIRRKYLGTFFLYLGSAEFCIDLGGKKVPNSYV